MKTRTLLTSMLAAGAIMLTTALPAHAADAYTDPLTRGDNVIYNNQTYALSIKPVTTETVTRYGHKVPTTYNVRVIQATKTSDKVLYSGNLGYSRTAYLRTKLTNHTTRDYGVATYVKKVTAFSAAYAKARVDLYVQNYREKTLRGDVTATARHVNDYIATHNQSLTGIENDNTVIVKSDSFFGYNDGDNLDIHVSVNPGDNPTNIYYVTGIEKADLYQSVFDGNSGAFRSGTITTVSNIN